MAIEAAHPDFWRKIRGLHRRVVGIAEIGESAPAKDLYAHFGITAQRVQEAVRVLAHRAAYKQEQAFADHIVPRPTEHTQSVWLRVPPLQIHIYPPPS